MTALGIKLATNACTSPYTPHPYWQNVDFKFNEGAPNCQRGSYQGTQQEIINTNGITVGASMQPVESTKSTQVNIVVRNDSNQQIQFLPISPTLWVTSPKIGLTMQVDPTKLANTIQKKGDRKAAWIRFWGENATTTLTSTMIGNGGFYPPFYGGGYPGGYWNRSGNMTIMNTQVPNYAAQAAALQRAADVSNLAQQNANTIKTSGLGPTTIAPGQTIAGALFFDAPKISAATLRIPIGNGAFKFDFPPGN